MATEWQDMLIDGILAGGITERAAVFRDGVGTLVDAVIDRDSVEQVQQTDTIQVERTAQVVFSPRFADGVVGPAVGDVVRFWDRRYTDNDDADLLDATLPAGATDYRITRVAQAGMYRVLCRSVPVRHVTALRSRA